MMQGMVGWAVNDLFKNMTRDHIGVMDLQVIQYKLNKKKRGWLTKIVQKFTRTNKVR